MRALALGLAMCGALLGQSALADPYDIEIQRLGNPVAGGVGYAPDANANFRVLMRELAAALTTVTLAPPGTLGHDGFAVGLELGLVHLHTDTFLLPTRSAFRSPLLVPSFRVRKGLPLSLELGARFTWLEKTSLSAATLDLKWAFLDGLGHLPDIAVRGHITRLFNTRDFSLTTGGLDLSIGKRFAVAGTLTLTPYGGYDLNWVSASSSRIDFNPGRDPATEAGTVDEQLTNTAEFAAVRPGANVNHRAYVGLRFGVGVLHITIEGAITAFGNVDAPSPDDPSVILSRALPPVLAFNSALALSF